MRSHNGTLASNVLVASSCTCMLEPHLLCDVLLTKERTQHDSIVPLSSFLPVFEILEQKVDKGNRMFGGVSLSRCH